MSVTDRISSLTPEQRALFELLRQKKAKASGPHLHQPPPVTRRSGPAGEGDWPLSFDQERLWFMHLLDPLGTAFNIDAASRWRGTLHLPAIQAAFNEIVRRHAAWRTTFTVVDGEPVQRVVAHRTQDLVLVDLTALPEPAREAEAEGAMFQSTRAVFELERGPLLRCTFIRIAPEDHVCILTVHHLVTDWIAFQNVWTELSLLYEAALAGRPSPLPELPVQYSDFSVWQREWLQGEVLDELLAYWRNKLRDFPMVLELPTDRPRPRLQRMRGGRVVLNIGRELADELRELSKHEGATMFMTVMAIVYAVLQRFSGQEQIILGSNNANRNRPEIEPLIGYFLTQVPFAVDLSGDPTFRVLLARVRRAALEAYSYQDLPFGKLIGALQPERDTSRPPLIQSLVLVLDGTYNKHRLAGITTQPINVYDQNARYDVMFGIYDYPHGLDGTIEYDADLFDETTAARLFEAYRLVAEAAVADPEVRLSRLPVLSEEARHQVLVEWNDTAVPETGWTVPARFAEQAARTPDAAALVFDGAPVSYGDLDRRAAEIGDGLRALGVKPEGRVALLAERSPGLVAALLGVWKAGAVCVPLDPASPADRLAALLADAEPAAVVHAGPLAEGVVPGGVATLDLEGMPGESSPPGPLSPLPPSPPPGEGEKDIQPGSLAYMIYTSGTTGLPKAIAVEHGSLAQTLASAISRFGFGPGDRMPHVARFSFDIALLELLAPLLVGGACELLRTEEVLEPAVLVAAVERATRVHAVPSLMRQVATVARQRGSEAFANLKTVFTGGDLVPPELVAELQEVFPAAEVVVLYGPTEATIVCTAWPVPRGARLDRNLIGRPLDGVELLVMDGRGEPAMMGVPGELWVGGPGVARGYFRREDLTAERFVERQGRRFYRTGDLVRHLPGEGGVLEFLGRTDFQVKIRGFRVEPGEIEAVLASHPAVREAVVVARDIGREKRLVAYCVPAGAAAQSGISAELRRFLADRLPAYMVPSAFVLLPELPLTAHGKVDRARLPEPTDLHVEETAAPPRTPTEELVAAVWGEVLGLPRVGRTANFFELGGHSLAATQVTLRLSELAGVEVPVQALFQAPTVAGMAELVEAALASGRQASALLAHPLVPVPRDSSGGDLPLSFAQERLWFIDKLVPGTPAYNMPLTLRIEGALQPSWLAAAFTTIAGRHEALRTSFVEVEGRAVQRVAPAPAEWPLPLADLSGLPAEAREEEMLRLAREDGMRSFDLARGPIFTTALLGLGAEEHVLLLNVHHIAADAWSMGVLVEEMAAFTAGRRLPELPVQVPDYAVWQRSWLGGEELERQLAFWHERLAGAPTALELPTDHPRPPAQTFRGGSFDMILPAGLSRDVAELSRRQGATPFMTLLAAWGVLMGRLARQRDLVVGTAIANRERPELERLIGFFVNTLAMRIDLTDDPSFSELAARTRRFSLDAFAHRDLPLEKLIEGMQLDRDRSRQPLIQSVFNLQNAPVGPIEVPGLTLTPLALAGETAKFDLTLTLSASSGLAGRVGEAETMRGRLEYAADLFEPATAERWMRHFETLLAGLVEAPGRPVSELPLLAAAERHQMLVDWNRTPSIQAPATLHALFRERARERPEAPALIHGERRIAYGELAARAGRLARRLRRLGVGPEVRVGIFSRRTPDLMVGVLAVLEAGGAYVPLDPAYPADRIAYLLADSGAPVVLTQAGLRESLPETAARVLLLEDQDEEGEPFAVDPAGEPSADNVAYVIYTSGSTGEPKGVLIRHGAAAALISWALRVFKPEELAVVLASTAATFDLSVFEMFAPLSAGGTVVLAENVLRLAELPAAGEVTLINTVPSALTGLLRISGLPASVRTINLAGEPLPGALVERLYRESGVRRVLNLYGPSEDTTYSTWEVVERGTVQPAIGRPVDGARVFLLDPGLRPVPAGVAGELCLGGVGLARGYLNRPDLTAERFVPDPFTDLSAEPGARLYRTGDLARYRPDGVLEYLGRTDFQVKVRGFRIELREVEAVIDSHPQVRACAVLVRTDPQGDSRLVAYVVPVEAGRLPAPGEIRRWLRSRLPDHMVPATLVPLVELPLTPHGKLDRDVLPEPGWSAAAERAYVPPGTPLEEDLVRLWAEVLGVTAERIGLRDNFFALGGHSLLATQLIAALREQVGIEVSLDMIFDTADLGELADKIMERELSEAGDAMLAEMLAEMDGLSPEELQELLGRPVESRAAPR